MKRRRLSPPRAGGLERQDVQVDATVVNSMAAHLNGAELSLQNGVLAHVLGRVQFVEVEDFALELLE